MKTQLLIIMLDLAIMFGIITCTEESTQAAVISLTALGGVILVGSRIIGAWLWAIEDDADKKPL